MIIRRRHKSHFTVVPNATVEDGSLSVEATGVLAYLLSRPRDWIVRLDHIAKTLRVGRGRLQRIFREFIAAGYATREQLGGKGGERFGPLDYIIRNVPERASIVEREECTDVAPNGAYSAPGRGGTSEFPRDEFPPAEIPPAGNRPAYTKKDSTKTDSTKTPLPPRSAPEARPICLAMKGGRSEAASSKGYQRPEVIQNRIAERLGNGDIRKGWLIFGELTEDERDQLTARERRGTLDDLTIVSVRTRVSIVPQPPGKFAEG